MIIMKIRRKTKYDVAEIKVDKNIVSFLTHLVIEMTMTQISHRLKGMNGTITSPTFSHETPSSLTSYKLGHSETHPDLYKYS